MLNIKNVLCNLSENNNRKLERCIMASREVCNKEAIIFEEGSIAFSALFSTLQSRHTDILAAGGYKKHWLCFILAVCYKHGIQVEQDDELSFNLLTKGVKTIPDNIKITFNCDIMNRTLVMLDENTNKAVLFEI